MQALLEAHAPVLPIVLPLLAGALLVLAGGARPRLQRVLSIGSMLLLLLLAAALVERAGRGPVQAYLLGNWAAPWGIALALDRLAALLLLLAAGVGTAAALAASGGDDRRGAHFHALLQFQMMGLNGAFLTADLFNLFVFFEVLLAASYGLLLHGRGRGQRERLKASVHYVVFNLVASALFLVAAALLYGVAGTLNLADLAGRLPQLAGPSLALAQAAIGLLLVVFAVKAALLPLYFWLPDTYRAATAPVACLFAIMTKVGVYAILRTTTLLAGPGDPGAPLLPLLTALALATLLLATLGTLAARRLATLVASLVIASAGTLLVGVGLASPAALAAVLVYLVHSTLFAGLWFLLAERIANRRGNDRLQPQRMAGPLAAIGSAYFVAAIAAAGLPPLAGFVGKAMLLNAAGETPHAAGVVAIVLGTSLATLVALARAGSVLFWEGGSPAPAAGTPRAWPTRLAAGGLLAAVLAAAAAAGPLAGYASAAAQQLGDRRGYIGAVLGAQPVAPAIDVRRELRERGGAK